MTKGQHAIVLGGSMAGMLAARALHDHFERVTLVERDEEPPPGTTRKGVPQAHHTHGLLAAGSHTLESFFPGLRSEIQENGGTSGDIGTMVRWWVSGYRLHPTTTGMTSSGVSRATLDSLVRRRLHALPRLTIMNGVDAHDLHGSHDSITGVRISRRGGDREARSLDADLVVDATGRGSKLPDWLRARGCHPPHEEKVRVRVVYTTARYRPRQQPADGMRGVIVGVAPPNLRAGVALAVDGETWSVSLGGYFGEKAPATHEGMLDYARGLLAPEIYELMRISEPMSTPTTHAFPFSQRRRYEGLKRFPRGLLVLGDAICSFNPIYGQGISVAAREAEELRDCLSEGVGGIAQRFFPRAAKIIDTPWMAAVGNDFGFSQTEGAAARGSGLARAYIRRLAQSASHQPETAAQLLRVLNLVDPLERLATPQMLWRAVSGGNRAA